MRSLTRSKVHTRRSGAGVTGLYALTNVVGWWDMSKVTTTQILVKDNIGVCDLTVNAFGPNHLTTRNGLTSSLLGSGSTERMWNDTLNPLAGRSHPTQPYGITVVVKEVGNNDVFVDMRITGTGPHAYQFGTITLFDTVSVSSGANSTATPFVYYFEWNGASSRVYRNGIQVGTGDPAPTTPGLTSVRITFGNTGGGGINGDNLREYMEMIASTGQQTAANVLATSASLRSKWGF